MFKKRETNEEYNNTVLINKNRELTELLDKIAILAIGNMYNNKDITLKKIKELVNDYQAKNGSNEIF